MKKHLPPDQSSSTCSTNGCGGAGMCPGHALMIGYGVGLVLSTWLDFAWLIPLSMLTIGGLLISGVWKRPFRRKSSKSEKTGARLNGFFLLLLASYAGLPQSSDAAPSLTLDLGSPEVDALVTRAYGRGSADDGLRGVPVTGGYDCDGDGYADMAFAQFLGDPLERIGAGEVTVVFGDGTIGGSTDSAVPQSSVLRIAGDRPNETTGSEIWMDDVTGDGLGDLLIARQNYSLGTQRLGAGALSVLIGSAAWKTQAAKLEYSDLRNPPNGLAVVTFVGPSDYDRLGIWIRTGDVTGDGISDFIVGADEVDGAGEAVSQNQGAVFLIRGGPHLQDAPEIVDLADFGSAAFPASMRGHVARIDPPAGSTNYHFGGTVQLADLDGNQRAEVIIAATLNRSGAGVRLPGAPSGTGEASGGSTDGTVFIVWDENFPPSRWPENYRFEATNPPSGDYTRIDGDSVAESFGEELLGGLDYSDDGFPDLMVGDLVADPQSRNNAGRGYIFYNAGNLRGLDFDLDFPPAGVMFSIIDGPVAGAISSDTALQGDFDGDGIADLGIGNPHDTFDGRSEAGSLHVLYGQPGGWPTAIDLLPANLPSPQAMRIALVKGAKGTSGTDRGDTLCYSAAAGDINGDGRLDLIVNEMAGNGFGGNPQDVGNLLVIDSNSLLDRNEPSLHFSVVGPLDFGSVLIAGENTTHSLVLSNRGGVSVSIESLSVLGPQAESFSIISDSGQSILAVGESRTISIRFDPDFVGRFGAALSLQTDADEHPVAIGLAGRGVDDVVSKPVVSIQLIGTDTVIEFPSFFGTDYTLIQNNEIGSDAKAEISTISGTGQALFFLDSNATDSLDRVFYQIRATR